MCFEKKYKTYDELCQVPACNFISLEMAGAIFAIQNRGYGIYCFNLFIPMPGETFYKWLKRNKTMLEIIEAPN